jgi:CBS domain-containing protein
MTLGEVTTAAPCIIPPTETAIEALGLMQDSGFRHVPVVDLGHRFRRGAARRAAISSVPATTGAAGALDDRAQARRARHQRPMNER